MKLSVCIPVYKVEAYVERCARSLFAQTLADMEFVFVDDCTPDGSVDVVRRVLADYPERRGQVKFVRHERNAGLIRARKTAMAASTGDLIAHCDSDDWADPGLYAAMAAAFGDPEVDMAFAPMVRNEDEPMPGSRTFDFAGNGRAFLDAANEIAAFNSNVNKTYRRAVALSDVEVPDGLKIGEDLCRTAQTAVLCRRIVSVSGAAYHYRETPASMSRAYDLRRAFDDQLAVLRILSARLPEGTGGALRKQLLKELFFRGLKHGVMTREELAAWRKAADGLSGAPWPPDTNLKQRVMLSVASRSYGFARWLFRHLSDGKVAEF